VSMPVPGAAAQATARSGWQNVRTSPSPALGGLAASAALLAVLAGRRDDPWLGLLAGALAGPVVLTLLWRPDLTRLSLRFRAPTRAVADEPSGHPFTVHNQGRLSTPPVRLTQRMRGFADVELLVPALAPGASAELAVQRGVLARGVPVTTVHTLRCSAPFGLIRRELTLHGLSRLVVHPRRAHPVDLAALGGDGDLATGVLARSGQQVHGVREWRPGDDVRRVHWRSTARRGQLVVLEPERTAGPRLAVLVAGQPQERDWERLLSVTAWSAAAAADDGGTVLLSAGPAGPPELEAGSPVEVLDWFAALGAAAVPDVAEAEAFLARAAPGDGVVLAVTVGVPIGFLDAVLAGGAALGRPVAVFQPGAR
jgi:uncharacterized protein (DUF58 family)